jgi:hypothetical protein
VLSTCSRRFRYTAHIKLKQDELMAGRSEREREREIIPEGNTQKSALVRIEGEPYEIA